MIELRSGDILKAGAEALVNPVNCVGVMGKGLALQFKQAFPLNYMAYLAACKSGAVVPGRVFVFTNQTGNPLYIMNFPTKRHWADKSRLGDIRVGLVALEQEVQRLRIQSIAIPPLGCGLGGLTWASVRPLIEDAFRRTPCRVLLFAPAEKKSPEVEISS